MRLVRKLSEEGSEIEKSRDGFSGSAGLFSFFHLLPSREAGGDILALSEPEGFFLLRKAFMVFY